MQAIIRITLKNGVLDPQGKAAEQALTRMGFSEASNLRQGKLITLDIAAASKDEAHKRVAQMCEQLLANTVIEDYAIELVE